ncbi:MAG TPA: alpha/beta hydrolase [Gemmatimonadales bacterium]
MLRQVLISIARVLAGLVAAYVLLCVVVWKIQPRLALPGVKGPLPPPAAFGMSDGEVVTVRTTDSVTLHGWYLPPNPAPPAGDKAPALLWFYGNAETVAGLGPVIQAFRPPGTGLLILDYRGYGTSEGTPSEDGMYRDADAAWRWLLARSEIDRARIGVYGRSIGCVAALYVATERPVAAVVLESPFTSVRDMARIHYPYLPRFIVTLKMDNETRVRHVRAPLMVLHGTDDEVSPIAMGKTIAEEGHAVEFVMIKGASHNETYDKGGSEYRTKLHEFIRAHL